MSGDIRKSERGHPNLSEKLSRALREAGAPGPPANEADDA